MEGQQFCLRWHNFQNTLLSSLPKLLDGGYLTDVTLSAGGSLQHPIIVLPGMEYANLCALVTFMYNGEVNIYQEQLPALLAMADTLHIRGLADIAGPPPAQLQEKALAETSIKKENKDNITSGGESLETVLETETAENMEESFNDQESIPYCVKTKPYYSINAKLNQREKVSIPPITTSTNKYTEKAYSESGMDESTPVLEDQITPVEETKPPPVWDSNFKFLSSSVSGRTSQNYNKSSVTCLICGKQLSNQYNLRVHMETHSNSSYSCTACSHVSRSRDALRKHVSYRHPVASSQKRSRYSTSKL
ncbi:Protein bric-a-brac 2 [Eufriesea mexicana]|uniref:Protein bric-a-brac 2 n=1 Tax=Eufriesea mexicana TaxID=516756 RepID=A0A310STX2_9HYME|nr:Protein bric-a-brac 2 [Eufriesea mexicana]